MTKIVTILLLFFVFAQAAFSQAAGKNETVPISQSSQKSCAGKDCISCLPVVANIVPTQTVTDKSAENAATDNHGAEWLAAYATVALCLVTGVLAIFTFFLWRSTKNLVDESEIISRTHERAYIFGGGPILRQIERQTFVNSQPTKQLIDADPPGIVFMTIQNYGRTPGFLKKVEWGLCKNRRLFPDEMNVSQFIDANPRSVKTVEKDDVRPPSNTPEAYRHVSFDQREEVGSIFFGKLHFEDVFGYPHHSTFKLLLVAGGSEPLPGCYSQDRDKPPKKRA